MLEGHLKTIRHKGDKDVRFDTRILLVIDRSDGQIAFEFFEGLLDLGELDVALLPQLGLDFHQNKTFCVFNPLIFCTGIF